MQKFLFRSNKINKYDPRSYYGLYLLDQNNLTDEDIVILNELKNKDIPMVESYLVEYLLSKIAKKNNQYDKELVHLKNFKSQCFKLRNDFNLQGLFYYNKIISNHYNKINFKNYKAKDNDLNQMNYFYNWFA